MKKIFLAVIFIICFSGLANAESWVLWEGFPDYPALQGGNRYVEILWQVAQGYPTYELCVKARIKKRKLWNQNTMTNMART